MTAVSKLTHAVRRKVLQTSVKSHRRSKSPLRRPLGAQVRDAASLVQMADELPAGVDELVSILQEDDRSISEHPDGFRWVSPDGMQEFGPFATRELARADRDRYSEEAPEPGETLQEAERELGISEWIDAETGAPAEGQSPPYLEED